MTKPCPICKNHQAQTCSCAWCMKWKCYECGKRAANNGPDKTLEELRRRFPGEYLSEKSE